jgi:hypothetical protein
MTKAYRQKIKKEIEQKFRKLKKYVTENRKDGIVWYEINKALFYFDVIGGAVGNGLTDEYDSEANYIFIGLEFCRSEEEVLELIKRTFNLSLDGHYDSADYTKIANKIWKIKLKHQEA